MRHIDPIIHWFAAALSTTVGFLAIMLTLALGFLSGYLANFAETWSILFNMYLSLAAIVIAATILIAQRRDTTAIHAKLDQIILSTEADNRLVGIEREPVETIDDVREAQHRQN